MRLVVFSYKHCWPSRQSPSGYATDGGFPLQMKALAGLFDETILVLPRRSSPPPSGLTDLTGKNLTVRPFPEPAGTGLRRKLNWLVLGAFRIPWMWQQIGRADAVHAVVPGDVGFLGLLLSLIRRRRVLVRHCGTWGRPQTLADRLLLRLLVRVAGDQCVVFATGGGDAPPSAENASIQWIFSTSLSRREIESLAQGRPRSKTRPRRLISLGRLTVGKNVASTLEALALVRTQLPDVVLDVVGSGPEHGRLRELADSLGITSSVTFHGNLDHGGVLEHLRRADVMVFPTRVAEGFPKAVLESLACGVPVVVPRVSVLPHLLRNGGGLLVDDVRPATLADAVLQLLDAPSSLGRLGPEIARGYTLEAWGDVIGRRLESAWGTTLREQTPDVGLDAEG